MPPTILSGVQGTYDILTNARKVDMGDRVALLEPDAAPLTVLLKRLKKRVTINPQFDWMEDELFPRFTAVNNGAGYLSTDTSIVVDNGNYIVIRDLVKVMRTSEVMLVTGVSSNTLTVTRAAGETAAVALVDNDPLMVLGPAYAENATLQQAKATQRTRVFNLTGIMRKPIQLSNTMINSQIYGSPDERIAQQKLRGIEHLVDIERAFLFGERFEDTTNDFRTTRGVVTFISTNRTDAGGTLTEGEFETWARTLFRYGKKTKLVLCSRLVASVVNQFAHNKLQSFPKDKTYGLSLMGYKTIHGEMMLIVHDLLESSPNTPSLYTDYEYGGWALGLDIETMAYRFIKNRDTQLLTNRQAPDADGVIDEWLTEAGLEMGQERRAAELVDVQA